jgi:hypothetical protein
MIIISDGNIIAYLSSRENTCSFMVEKFEKISHNEWNVQDLLLVNHLGPSDPRFERGLFGGIWVHQQDSKMLSPEISVFSPGIYIFVAVVLWKGVIARGNVIIKHDVIL